MTDITALIPNAQHIDQIVDVVKTAQARLIASGWVRLTYNDDTAGETIEEVVNTLLESTGARVISEDPWGEPPWVELRI